MNLLRNCEIKHRTTRPHMYDRNGMLINRPKPMSKLVPMDKRPPGSQSVNVTLMYGDTHYNN